MLVSHLYALSRIRWEHALAEDGDEKQRTGDDVQVASMAATMRYDGQIGTHSFDEARLCSILWLLNSTQPAVSCASCQ